MEIFWWTQKVETPGKEEEDVGGLSQFVKTEVMELLW